jgi:hypothetical protein
MNNTLHTPAPWQVSPYGNITSKSGKIASVEQMPGNYESEKQANARLISAAPDLLSALESLAVWNDGEPCFCHVHGESERARYTPHDSYCDKARAAIRKAKGEA